MDGFDVMEELKKIETHGYLPVLVITAQPATSCAHWLPVPRFLSPNRLTWLKCETRIHTCWKFGLLYKNSRLQQGTGTDGAGTHG